MFKYIDTFFNPFFIFNFSWLYFHLHIELKNIKAFIDYIPYFIHWQVSFSCTIVFHVFSSVIDIITIKLTAWATMIWIILMFCPHVSSNTPFMYTFVVTVSTIMNHFKYYNLCGVITVVVHIRLSTVQESCLYIDGWCAPGVHTGRRTLIVKLEI